MDYQYFKEYIRGATYLVEGLSIEELERIVEILVSLKKRQGRLFLLGVGGSAANCSHAVNDFRKICGVETYAPTDNVSELTARTNDEGWETVFVEWLKTSNLGSRDAVMIFSVGGGSLEKNISTNIVKALQHAKKVKAKIIGIVSRDGGYTKQVADACILIPVIDDKRVTPYAEAFQGLVWHGIVNHPLLSNYYK